MADLGEHGKEDGDGGEDVVELKNVTEEQKKGLVNFQSLNL